MKIPHYLPIVLLAGLTLASCADDKSSNATKLQIRLTDAPGDFQKVLLDVRQIEVHLKDEQSADGWELLPFTPQTLNVLDYVNGRSALLVDTDFEPGDLKEIRLVLGPNSTVTTRDGQIYELKTPSGQTSGVKLKLDNATLRERETFQLLLDFDVAKSIVQRGNWRPGVDKKERFLLKPVIRVIAQDIAGGLRGTVTPSASLPQILAIRASITPADTFSTSADASGGYQLSSLPSGVYRVEFFPTTTAPTGQPTYKNVVRTDITVTNNQVTELGQTKLD
ncbi:hypothetical protein GCM10011375_10690 [Hymenobacter qilianensis]|uniref:Uncharacterized protein n=2 Tax=Hymenobacter qilianensis TaxID=1385715 RepID=A0ACB5PNW9_9BACT|nr:DUF4382 domain-containing protein [Hymenobacter qilianensis]QNP53347.1 DUF4382 domain-containing protein [Hymenobacter qilianensis]GGF57408.1 hypothetical protein GCM10011375_10690 [Hymenobacter qilianensis]